VWLSASISSVFRLAVPLILLLVLSALLRVYQHRTGKSYTFTWLPKGGSDALLQLTLFVLADTLYETVRGIAESNATTAFTNARSIVDAEQGMGVFIERSVQAWAMGHRVIIDFANFMYVNSHFVLTTGALVWLYLRHNNRFYFVRNMFMVAMGLALVGYLLVPTAPPRFFPELGFVDTLSYYVNVKHDSGLVALFFNPYAAVPSMHVAFSLMIAMPAMMIVRRRIAKVLWAVYPLVVSFVVIVTGNHWLFDVVAGATVAGTSALVARHVLSRLWPAAWAWEAGPAQATA
jgi:membrane-associated phospholipid phosphatase